jgi:hypothetical protein
LVEALIQLWRKAQVTAVLRFLQEIDEDRTYS